MDFETLALASIATALIFCSSAHFVSQGIARGLAHAEVSKRRAKDLHGLRQAAEIARLNSELQSAAVGSSMQWRVMEVAQVIDESEDCRSFYLVDPYGQALPAFQPGQHLLVRPALAGAFQTTRCYSLSHSPDSRFWRITVKRQTVDARRPRDQEGGLSQWLHDRIGVGDCLLVGGPNGQFYLASDNQSPLVLVAAGVGITPLASILHWSLQHTPQRPIQVLFQAKDRQHWPLGKNLHQAALGGRNLHVETYFSRETQADLEALQHQYPGQIHAGRLDVQQIHRPDPNADKSNSDYFLCGPASWMESIRESLIQQGVNPARVHWESFGSVPTGKPSQGDASQQAIPVSFVRSDVSTHWHDPEQSLWELAREHRVEIPSGCLSGVCGSCRVQLLSGQVEYDRPVGIELGDDECLSCIARPVTECRLDI